jgi:uncharacterized protein
VNNVDKAYIVTYTGCKFNLLEPDSRDIDVVDIAHALAMQCRWTGHTKHHYSIAQHAYYCSFIGPDNEAFHRLNHDDSEAYIGDMSRPLKHYTEAGDAYRRVEWPIQNLIYESYGMSIVEPISVKLADEGMLYAEQQQLLPPLAFETSNVFKKSLPAGIQIEEWTPKFAEKMWMDRFLELYKGRIN